MVFAALEAAGLPEDEEAAYDESAAFVEAVMSCVRDRYVITQ